MKTLINTIAALFVAILLVANVHADFVTDDGKLEFTTDRTNYLEGVHGTDWVFTSVDSHTGGQGKNPWTQWTYTVGNNAALTTTGVIYSDNFNGNGANGEGRGHAGVDMLIGTGSMYHNSANNFTMTFADPFVDSFFIALTPWSSYSAADAFNLTISYWANDVIHTVTSVERFTDSTPFLGILLEEGAYLSSVTFTSIGTGNNGYLIAGMGFGDNGFAQIYPEITVPGGHTADYTAETPPPCETPAPAPCLLMALGLSAVAAYRRMNLQKIRG